MKYIHVAEVEVMKLTRSNVREFICWLYDNGAMFSCAKDKTDLGTGSFSPIFVGMLNPRQIPWDCYAVIDGNDMNLFTELEFKRKYKEAR